MLKTDCVTREAHAVFKIIFVKIPKTLGRLKFAERVP